nr:unnamed protein product [Callosobruchus chinensis]
MICCDVDQIAKTDTQRRYFKDKIVIALSIEDMSDFDDFVCNMYIILSSKYHSTVVDHSMLFFKSRAKKYQFYTMLVNLLIFKVILRLMKIYLVTYSSSPFYKRYFTLTQKIAIAYNTEAKANEYFNEEMLRYFKDKIVIALSIEDMSDFDDFVCNMYIILSSKYHSTVVDHSMLFFKSRAKKYQFYTMLVNLLIFKVILRLMKIYLVTYSSSPFYKRYFTLTQKIAIAYNTEAKANEYFNEEMLRYFKDKIVIALSIEDMSDFDDFVCNMYIILSSKYHSTVVDHSMLFFKSRAKKYQFYTMLVNLLIFKVILRLMKIYLVTYSSSPFYKRYFTLTQKIAIAYNTEAKANEYFNEEMLRLILKKYIPYCPLWVQTDYRKWSTIE